MFVNNEKRIDFSFMKKTLLFSAMILLLCHVGKTQNKIWDETEQEKQERMAW